MNKVLFRTEEGGKEIDLDRFPKLKDIFSDKEIPRASKTRPEFISEPHPLEGGSFNFSYSMEDYLKMKYI